MFGYNGGSDEREGNPKPKPFLSAGEARRKSEEAAKKRAEDRRALLIKSIENQVSYGETSLKLSTTFQGSFHSYYMDERDVSFLENLGYKVERVTETMKVPKYPQYGGTGTMISGVMFPHSEPEYVDKETEFFKISW